VVVKTKKNNRGGAPPPPPPPPPQLSVETKRKGMRALVALNSLPKVSLRGQGNYYMPFFLDAPI